MVFENIHQHNRQVVEFAQKATADYGLYSKRIYGVSKQTAPMIIKKW